MAIGRRKPFPEDVFSEEGAKRLNQKLFEIKKLYYGFFQEIPDAIPAHASTNPSNFLKILSIFITEIVIGSLGGITGIHSILESQEGGIEGYILSALPTIADASINYALLFPAYKAAAGLVSDGEKLDETKETIKQLNNLNKILDYLSENENILLNENEYEKLEAIYSQLEKKMAVSTPLSLKKIVLLVGKIALLVILFISVLTMRIGGGYLTLDALFQNLLGIDKLSFQWGAQGIGAGSTLVLYILSAILTRKNAILDWVYPLRKDKFKRVRGKLDKLKEKRSRGVVRIDRQEKENKENNSTFNSLKLSYDIQELCTQFSYTQKDAFSKNRYIDFLNLGIIIVSEIIFAIFVNDFVGMYSALFALKAKLSFWQPLYTYIIAMSASVIDTVVQFILMFPVLKATVCDRLETVAENEKKVKEEELLYLNRMMTEVIKQESDSSGRVLLNNEKWLELSAAYEDFYDRNRHLLPMTVSYGKKCLEYFLLCVFIAIRSANSYFLLNHFLLGVGVTVTGGWRLIPGIFIALYAYNGYVTRRKSISNLFHPSDVQEFDMVGEKFKKLDMMMTFKTELNANTDAYPQLDKKKTLAKTIEDDDTGKAETVFLKIVSDQKTQKEKNLAFQVGSELIFSTKRSNRCLDTILFFKRPLQWKESTKKVREQAWDQLKAFSEKKNIPKEQRLTALKQAKELDIFKQHRNWFLFQSFVKTATGGKIDQRIMELEAQRALA